MTNNINGPIRVGSIIKIKEFYPTSHKWKYFTLYRKVIGVGNPHNIELLQWQYAGGTMKTQNRDMICICSHCSYRDKYIVVKY